ncbi:hypothetical protein [Streptomyces sp. NPDC018031]|uniref:hypothetical protein n=1 Tax=Streptomyces sp. NPDC018031 TaxID=3365033 RepID=UPI00379C8AD4
MHRTGAYDGGGRRAAAVNGAPLVLQQLKSYCQMECRAECGFACSTSSDPAGCRESCMTKCLALCDAPYPYC